MLVQVVLLGGGLAAYMRSHNKRDPESVTQARKDKVSARMLLKDFKTSVLGDERQQLQMTLDPETQDSTEKFKKEINRNLIISASATSMAMMASISPVFTILGIAGVYYLARDVIVQVWQDMRRGHYFSVYLGGCPITGKRFSAIMRPYDYKV